VDAGVLVPHRPGAKPCVGQLFNTVTNGIRTMPAYGPQLAVADRWAIVAYVRALQRSQNAGVADVPPSCAHSCARSPRACRSGNLPGEAAPR